MGSGFSLFCLLSGSLLLCQLDRLLLGFLLCLLLSQFGCCSSLFLRQFGLTGFLFLGEFCTLGVKGLLMLQLFGLEGYLAFLHPTFAVSHLFFGILLGGLGSHGLTGRPAWAVIVGTHTRGMQIGVVLIFLNLSYEMGDAVVTILQQLVHIIVAGTCCHEQTGNHSHQHFHQTRLLLELGRQLNDFLIFLEGITVVIHFCLVFHQIIRGLIICFSCLFFCGFKFFCRFLCVCLRSILCGFHFLSSFLCVCLRNILCGGLGQFLGRLFTSFLN